LETYTASQPTDQQRTAWRDVVTSLLNADDHVHPDCNSIRETFPHELQGIYTVTEVDDGKFCALVEVDNGAKEYGKGWGLFVVPNRKNPIGISGTSVHLSAPHPVYDLYTAAQAMYVFEQTGAKSLYIPGRSRKAFQEPTDCVVQSKTEYWKTDATHDKGEMMFETYVAIVNWQNDPNAGGGCIDTDVDGSCAYIQFNGKAKMTCKGEQIFLSAGLGRDPASQLWYDDCDHDDFPVHRLAAQLREQFPWWSVTIPTSPDSTCSLTGTKDIIGRLINGVPEDQVCTEFATVEGATGAFVQIEEDIEARKKDAWPTWASAFLDAFSSEED